MSDSDIPQWKKDLIARLRSQNKRTAHAQQQLFSPSQQSQRTLLPPSSAVQQPVAFSREKCECATTMVQERSWGNKSDSDEDLHYGPGIVSKLKERYLSLAQREKPRPSILRKAASLENILDDAPETNRSFQPSQNKNVPNRYAKRGSELKRARSVETISTAEQESKEPKRESLHEEMLIANRGSLIIPEKPPGDEENKFVRVIRPKRIAPVMSEKEKPPADVVKQAKMIFERRPEQRTRPPQQTGEVAAKVATYKHIIGQNKSPKKPAIKVKPAIDKPKTNGIRVKTKVNDREVKTEQKTPQIPLRTKSPEKKPRVDVPPEAKPDVPTLLSSDVPSPKLVERTPSLPSPIPDISRVDFKVEENGNKPTSLTETPDLILTSNPVPVVNSPSFRISATEKFIKEEIRLSQTERLPSTPAPQHSPEPTEPAKKPTPPSTPTSNSMTFNFAKGPNRVHNHLPTVNKNVLNTQTPPSQPLKLEINGVNETTTTTKPPKKQQQQSSTNGGTPNQILLSAKPTLTKLEAEKNFINTAKTLEQPKNKNNSVASITKHSANEVTTSKVPKVKKPARELENTSIVFNFTDRKDVPDYVQDDGVKRPAILERPKVGEGGIILLPGASIGESFTDEDEEISLEGPPSPCDVAFINDNILIDGKSSLRQKTKKPKLKISFVTEGPQIYEYPSETSLLIEDSPKSPPVAQLRHSVPSLSGSSSLANYIPKGTEDFQPGITRSVQSTPPIKDEGVDTTDSIPHEVEKPITFSSGANSDILF